jgi:acetylglutamate kinase
VTNNERAAVLAQALPHIKRFRGETIVVKYGGAAMINESLRAEVAQDLALMSCVGIRAVLVHGGGPEIDAMLRALGKEPRFVGGLRYTDEETMEVVQMVLAGKVNKDLVGLLVKAGCPAVGLCGVDGGLISARRRSAGEDLGLVGDIEAVNPAVLEAALAGGFLPVVATVAAGAEGEGAAHKAYNGNAGTAAAAIAAALGARKLVLLTDVPGILRNVADPGTLVRELPRSGAGALIKEGVVTKGMIPKVECCAKAVADGVGQAHIIDGRVPHALLVELFTDAGIGTMIV